MTQFRFGFSSRTSQSKPLKSRTRMVSKVRLSGGSHICMCGVPPIYVCDVEIVGIPVGYGKPEYHNPHSVDSTFQREKENGEYCVVGDSYVL